MEQHIQYCTTPEGVRIAYAAVGSGPPFVFVPGWTSHLELEWVDPARRRIWEIIASRTTLIRHDKRGNGLSSRHVGEYTIESSVRDVEALVDHLGLTRFAIGGLSEGTPIATLYTARHLERITKLVLYGSFAWGEGLLGPPEMREAIRLSVKTQWGVASRLMSAIMLGDDPFLTAEQYAAYQRAAASPDDALAVLDRALNADIRDALPQINVPTLVLHHRDDVAVPIERGQEVAAGIRGARFLSGPGGHIPSEDGMMGIAQAVLSFLADEEITDLGPYRDETTTTAPSVVDANRTLAATTTALYDDGSLLIDVEQHVVAHDGLVLELSPTEFRLIVELARAPGRVHSYDELLHRVWGAEYVGETDFLHVYISRLRRKLGRDAIATERGFGYRLLGGHAAARQGQLQVVLFTDLVGHSEMMSRLGDMKGRAVLSEHEDLTRDVLKRYGGVEVKSMGDGFMAAFDSATGAVGCAVALQEAFATRNRDASEHLSIRVGLNIGEPISDDDDLFGTAVILASRIANEARADEILVPDALRHLLAGKPFTLENRGAFHPKGLPEPVRIYSVRWDKPASPSQSGRIR
jgi:class 3 adenylate cyclase/pimeloyl-ACP methyl ester carboxylesterase